MKNYLNFIRKAIHTKIDKISNDNRNFLHKKVSSKISFSIDNKNNKSNLNKESLEGLIDEYFKELDGYEIID